MESELEYGNHKSAAKYGGDVHKKAATDVVLGRTVVFPVTQAREIRRLRIPPVGVLEKEKVRVIHDWTFGGRVTFRGARKTEEQEAHMEPSVNGNTD